jgi:hypothetical protein
MTTAPTTARPARQQIAAQTAAGLRDFAAKLDHHPVMVGFDGFVDSIIDVVDKRRSVHDYAPVQTIEAFGRRIQGSAGQSANYELVTKLEKLGGNGPIMANALTRFGLPVTYIGSVGHPTLHPVFEELARQATVHPIAEPGYTDALEFTDGKLMFGKQTNLRDVNYDQLCRIVGEENLIELLSGAALLGMVNWTMLVEMDSIWDALIDRVLPALPQRADPPLLFIDLADPAKRLRRDLLGALGRISKLNEHTLVVLGLNLNESTQIGGALGLSTPDQPEASIVDSARSIRAALGVQGVVVHPRTSAAAAWLDEAGQVVSDRFDGPFVQAPQLSTGAGDNFNAGFCLGMLAGLSIPQALCTGTATSGYYVRHAQSPTLHQFADFCDVLPEPEPSVATAAE